MKTNTIIQTNDAKRIAKRLLNHWKHKFEVAETDDKLSIFMPDATVILHPQTENLLVNLETKQDDDTHLQHVIIEHLNRMAQQEFTAKWQHQA